MAGPAGFAVGLHVAYTTPRYLLQSYAAEWRERYARAGYLMVDPSVHWGLANSGWIRWRDLPRSGEPDIIAEAARHGMPFGVTIAALARGSRSIASFARNDRDYESGEASRIEAHVLELHERTLNVHALPPSVHDLLRRLSIIVTRG